MEVTAVSENGVAVKRAISFRAAWANGEPAREVVEIDFEDADIVQFIKFVGEVTGKRFVIDPSVNGNVTIFFPEKVPVKDVYGIFQSVLEVHGFTTVQAGSMVKIVPASSATGKGVELKKQAPVP